MQNFKCPTMLYLFILVKKQIQTKNAQNFKNYFHNNCENSNLHGQWSRAIYKYFDWFLLMIYWRIDTWMILSLISFSFFII